MGCTSFMLISMGRWIRKHCIRISSPNPGRRRYPLGAGMKKRKDVISIACIDSVDVITPRQAKKPENGLAFSVQNDRKAGITWLLYTTCEHKLFAHFNCLAKCDYTCHMLNLMILVDEAGGFFPSINHSPWNDVTLADFVMPFFLFIVGVALALAYKNVPDRVDATKKAVLRALKLFIVGLILRGGYFHGVQTLTGVDILNNRFMGVLQRISIAYLVATLCQIWLRNEEDVDSGDSLLRKYRYQLFVGLIITSIYLALLYGLYVPDWEYQIPVDGSESKLFSVKCGVRGDTGPACNAVGIIDRKVLGIHHLYRRPIYARTKQCSINSPDTGPLPADAPSWCQAPFDPEGLLSSVMAIVTCLIGLQFGHVIVHLKEHRDRFIQWMIPSLFLLALAFALDFCGIHMNKALYSFSYTCATAGIAGVLFTGIYLLVDVYGYRRPTIVMEWMGMNALLIYVLVACNLLPILIQGFYWKEPRNNILRLVGVGS